MLSRCQALSFCLATAVVVIEIVNKLFLEAVKGFEILQIKQFTFEGRKIFNDSFKVTTYKRNLPVFKVKSKSDK